MAPPAPDAAHPDRASRGRGLRLVLFVTLPLIAFGGLAWLVRQARYVPPDPPVDTSPAAAAAAERRLETAVREVKEARQAAAAGEARPYRIEVRQEDANTLLRTDPRAKSLLERHDVERPSLEIENGRLKAGALVTFRGQRVYVTAEGPLRPDENGRLQFRPENLWLGKTPAPAPVTEELARRAAEAFQNGELKLPGRVKDIWMEDGRLVIEGSTGE